MLLRSGELRPGAEWDLWLFSKTSYFANSSKQELAIF